MIQDDRYSTELLLGWHFINKREPNWLVPTLPQKADIHKPQRFADETIELE